MSRLGAGIYLNKVSSDVKGVGGTDISRGGIYRMNTGGLKIVR